MSTNEWVSENYEMLKGISIKVNQGKGDHEDLLHYALEQFMLHPNAQELVDKGHSKWFIVRVLTTSARSPSSGFWREYRGAPKSEIDLDRITCNEKYDYDRDTILEWLTGIIEDMKHDDVDMWYRATILEMCLTQPRLNFSEISRKTGIPRTSISNAYNEAIEWIKKITTKYGNNYSTFRDSLRNYSAN